MIHIFAFTAAFIACLGYAIYAGGKPERTAMLAQLVAFLLSLAAISFGSIPVRGLPIGLALVDFALALALSLLAMKANRLWPIVLAGMQVATIFAHFARLMAFPLPAAGYIIFVQFWSWPMLMVTAVGIYKHQSRTRNFGEEPDWKPLWPHSARAVSAI
jgi:hypothetical protein